MTATLGKRADHILLVEDQAEDVELVRQVIQECSHAIELHVARAADEALAFLRRQGSCARAPRASLILVDLNMPGKSGRELLGALKGDPQLRRIPVVVLTTSTAQSDVRAVYDLHANAFVAKPVDFEGFALAMRRLVDFWFGAAAPAP